MYNLRILNKTNNDYKQYISLIKDFRNLKSEVTYKLFLEYYDKTFKNSIIFVLEKNNLIVATTKVLIEHKIYNNKAIYGHIEDVIVKKQFRGQKLGQQIISQVINYCVKNNFHKLILSCDSDLINFYKKNGFVVKNSNMIQLL